MTSPDNQSSAAAAKRFVDALRAFAHAPNDRAAYQDFLIASMAIDAIVSEERPDFRWPHMIRVGMALAACAKDASEFIIRRRWIAHVALSVVDALESDPGRVLIPTDTPAPIRQYKD